jgi:benzoyl-CoA reductase/2-hydroxyglutaryl-CoA dehydratase subunit BcrC/BadD/HgdB
MKRKDDGRIKASEARADFITKKWHRRWSEERIAKALGITRITVAAWIKRLNLKKSKAKATKKAQTTTYMLELKDMKKKYLRTMNAFEIFLTCTARLEALVRTCDERLEKAKTEGEMSSVMKILIDGTRELRKTAESWTSLRALYFETEVSREVSLSYAKVLNELDPIEGKKLYEKLASLGLDAQASLAMAGSNTSEIGPAASERTT